MSQKMNPDIKAEWVAALRSGEYQQARGALTVRQDDGTWGYCCLGVLCDLAVSKGVDIQVREDLSSTAPGSPLFSRSLKTYDSGFSILPDSVKHWAGLTSNNPAVPIQAVSDASESPNWRGRFMLSELNDGEPGNDPEDNENWEIRPRTFNEIADFIEEHL